MTVDEQKAIDRINRLTIGELHGTIIDIEKAIKMISDLRVHPRYDDDRVISVSECNEVKSVLRRALKIIKAFDIS